MSAFIGLEGFYIIESAEILHGYHYVPLKNASSMITATRNYIQCLSASCVMDKLVREGRYGKNVFNPGLMHKLIV